MSEGNNKVKEELFSLFKGIKDDIPNDQFPLNKKTFQNITTIDSITLITYIKETIPLLINHKISEAITQNNKNDLSSEFEDNINWRKEYHQLENQLKKMENDIRYYLQLYLKSEIQKKVLEMKLNAYLYLEQEYENLKEKVKYEGEKFLDNERKDNEIFILRAENSSLKKEIVNLEHLNKKKEQKIQEHIKTIKDLQNNVEKLNNKIFDLKRIAKNNNTINANTINYNLTNSKNKTELIRKNNSTIDINSKRGENMIFNNIEYFHKIDSRNYFKNDIKKINSIPTRNIKLSRKIIFNTPKNESMRIESKKNISNGNFSINKANTQFFQTIYNKLQSQDNRSVKIPLLALMKIKRRKSKSLSVNKESKMAKNDICYTFDRKKIFKNLLFSNPKTFSF